MTSLNFTNSGLSVPPKEAEIQKACWSWLAVVKVKGGKLQDFSYMVPNGTEIAGNYQGRARYMASLKAQGFRVGVSDLVIAYPVGDYHGAYIELKRDRKAYKGPAAVASAIRPDQRDWLLLMRSVGYFTGIAYGSDEFQSLVRSYLRKETAPPLPFEEQ